MKFIFLISLIFSLLAALMAFLITYDEFRHHYPNRGPAIRAGLQMAVMTLLVFLVLALIVSLVLPQELR